MRRTACGLRRRLPEGRKEGWQAIKYVRVRTNQLLLRRGTAQGRPSLLFAVRKDKRVTSE